MNAKTFALSALTAVCALTLAPAQDLDGEIVRNSDDTVTYTIDLQGPPNAQTFVLVGLNPIWPHLPTPFGPLMIDPSGSMTLGVTQLDPFGRGALSVTVPSASTIGFPLRFQSVTVTPFAPPLLSHRDLVLQHDEGPSNLGGNGQPSFAMAYSGNDQTADITARFKVGGPAGKAYVVSVFDQQGNEIAFRRIQLDRNGQAPAVEFGPTAGVQRGHRWVVSEDIGQGHVLPMWRGSFR